MLQRDEILKLAELARLELSDEEVERYTAELGAVLGYIEQLSQVNVTGIEPTSQVTGLMNVLRDDEPDDALSLTREQQESIVPAYRDGYVVVPAVLDKGDE